MIDFTPLGRLSKTAQKSTEIIGVVGVYNVKRMTREVAG